MQETLNNPSKPCLEETLKLKEIENTSVKSDNNSLLNSNTSTNNDLDLSIFKIKLNYKFFYNKKVFFILGFLLYLSFFIRFILKIASLQFLRKSYKYKAANVKNLHHFASSNFRERKNFNVFFIKKIINFNLLIYFFRRIQNTLIL